VTHDFRNTTDAPARAYNVFIPGLHFERSFASWVPPET
jgi:hypothetical protein